MGVVRCKMCGHALQAGREQTIAACQHCMGLQALPRQLDEQQRVLYDRAEECRRNGEFEKALGIYECIADRDTREPEVYWSMVLCHYGVRYFVEPGTGKCVPAVTRPQRVSVLEDSDYQHTLALATGDQQAVYMAQAQALAGLKASAIRKPKKKAPRKPKSPSVKSKSTREKLKISKKQTLLIAVPAGILAILAVILLCLPAVRYHAAEDLFTAGKYREALKIYEQLGDYQDSLSRIKLCKGEIQRKADYAQAEKLLADGEKLQAAKIFYAIAGYSDARRRCFALWDDIAPKNTVAAVNHTVGLKADGTVVAVGDNDFGQCDVSDWVDIVSIAAGSDHTVGLKADGTVVAVGDNDYDQCDVSDWADIVSIAAGVWHTVGLKADGTVVAVGDNGYGQCDVSDWVDIVSIATGGAHTVGLKADGTVVAVGYNHYGQCDVSAWKDIKLPQ